MIAIETITVEMIASSGGVRLTITIEMITVEAIAVEMITSSRGGLINNCY